MSGSYLMYGSVLEKCGNFGKNGRFSGRIWPDWGNTTRADMAGLGSIGNTPFHSLKFRISDHLKNCSGGLVPMHDAMLLSFPRFLLSIYYEFTNIDSHLL